MRVVAEGGFVQVTKVGHNSIHTSKEALILFDNVELVTATAQARNSLA